MDWLVIKGRGENRGRYLRQRYEGKGKKHRLVSRWVEKQAQANRHEEYDGGRTERLAREVNGYIVRIVAPPAIVARVSDLEDFISEHADCAAPQLACYWISGYDDGDYCRDCADEKIRKLRRKYPKRANDFELDGGWSTSHDHCPYCTTCGAPLEGTLTDYGADEELIHYFESPPAFDSPDAWANLEAAVMNLRKNDPRWRKIARLVDAAAEAERRHEEHLAQLAAAPGMRETRGALLGLLQARQVQKKASASYRLWDELQRYRRLDFSTRHESPRHIRLWERRLQKEAEEFLGHLGYTWGGQDCFDAPYGGYHWVFVVEIEQHRLWGTPAFLEGAAFTKCSCTPPAWAPRTWRGWGGRVPRKLKARIQRAGGVDKVPTKYGYCPHGRDANPYPAEDPRHHIWDCGFCGVLPEEKPAPGSASPTCA